MTKLYIPDTPPEDLDELYDQINELARFLNTNPQAKHLLLEAKAGHISKDACIMNLLKLGMPVPQRLFE